MVLSVDVQSTLGQGVHVRCVIRDRPLSIRKEMRDKFSHIQQELELEHVHKDK